MGKRRGHGEGAIYQRESDGIWCTSIDLGIINGKRKRRVIYGKTRKEVAEKLKAAQRDQMLGLKLDAERQTVGQFLDYWLEQIIKLRARPTTYARYKSIITHHLKPHLGHIRLDKLAPEEVQAMLGALRTKPGGRAGATSRSLAPKSVQNVRIVLRAALNQALKWGRVTRNVATLVDPPRVEKFVIAPLTREQAQQLLDSVRGDRFEALYRLALSLGLRRGEVLALHWSDLDFTKRTLKVAGSVQVIDGKPQIVAPKTASSVRTLPLPDVLAQVLLRHREQQERERAANDEEWNALKLVFPSTNGQLVWPRSLSVGFKRVLRNAGLPETTRFHDLRHSCATLLIQQGVHLRVVMEILGHSSITTTADTYAHVLPETQRDATSKLDALFPERDDKGEYGRTDTD